MTSDSADLAPIEQRSVSFYDDQLTVVVVAAAGQDPQFYVPIRPICDQLGIAWAAQLRRIRRHLVLSEVAEGVTVTVTPGGLQQMICLPLDHISGWLMTIDARRVKEELRERIVRYQRECYQVLSEAVRDGRLSFDDRVDELLAGDSEAAQAYRMAMAVARLARQQIMLEARVDNTEQRIERIEALLSSPDRFVDADQASAISQAVKTIAHELGQRSGRNEYGGVYGELYRRFGITSYKQLPASRFQEAMNFLNGWFQSLQPNDVQF